MQGPAVAALCVVLSSVGLVTSHASAQAVVAKERVAAQIARVENNVDEFRKYLERRGDNARDAKDDAKDSGKTSGRRKGEGANESQKARAESKKDALDDALGDLNRSTNRLRRKFDATDRWIETKEQVERVVDDARKVNQALTRGSYGSEAARLWAALRTGINDLARTYNVTPLGV